MKVVSSAMWTSGVLAVGWIAGCGSSEPSVALSARGNRVAEPTSTTSSAVQGGTTDTTDMFAVGIVQTSQLKSSLISVCSGALLAPNLVATARHCVSPLSTQVVDCSTSAFGSALPPADVLVTTATQMSRTSSFVGVSQIITPTDPSQSKVCGNDIALLILDRSITLPEYVIPAISPPITDHSTYGTTVEVIGYGIDTPTDMTGQTAGVRRSKRDVGLVCIPNDRTFVDCYVDPQVRQVLAGDEFISGDGSTCDGDSGSSAFDQASFDRGQWVSLGILSRGGVSQDGQTCVQPIYTRYDGWGSLIISAAKTAASAGGYTPPQWATASVAVSADAGTAAAIGAADGTPCSDGNECRSTKCVAGDADAATGVCASSCIAGGCAQGFTCTGGYCLAAPSSSSGGGCGIGRQPPVEEGRVGGIGAALAALVALVATRRRRSYRQHPCRDSDS